MKRPQKQNSWLTKSGQNSATIRSFRHFSEEWNGWPETSACWKSSNWWNSPSGRYRNCGSSNQETSWPCNCKAITAEKPARGKKPAVQLVLDPNEILVDDEEKKKNFNILCIILLEFQLFSLGVFWFYLWGILQLVGATKTGMQTTAQQN